MLAVWLGMLLESMFGLDDRTWLYAALVAVFAVLSVEWEKIPWREPWLILRRVEVVLGWTEVPTKTGNETRCLKRLRIGSRNYLALPDGNVSRLYFVEVSNKLEIAFPGQSFAWREHVERDNRRYTHIRTCGPDEPGPWEVDLIVRRNPLDASRVE